VTLRFQMRSRYSTCNRPNRASYIGSSRQRARNSKIQIPKRHMLRWCEEVSEEIEQKWLHLKVSQSSFDQFMKQSSTRNFNALLQWEELQQKLAV
jgi:hypothetical protein